MFEPSVYQQAIFSQIESGRGDVVVMACPGSGKTRTLEEVAKRIHSSSVLAVCFNKHIAEELQTRMPKTVACKTLHSLGYGALKKMNKSIGSPNEYKYKDICKQYAEDVVHRTQSQELKVWKLAAQMNELARFCRLTLTDPRSEEDIYAMIDYFGLEINDPSWTIPYVKDILAEGNKEARYGGRIDFTDMIYLPVLWKLPVWGYEYVLADEAQDFSACQLELVMMCRGKGGRMLFVGDPMQSIYGFAGSLPDSMSKIVNRTQAITMPLSICYRCPKSHVELLQKINSEIEPTPWAESGEIKVMHPANIINEVKEGDLILCRKTSPLVLLCIELISKKIPARVRGRDIGKNLTTMINEVTELAGFRYEDFNLYLNIYEADKVTRLSQRENAELLIQSVKDKVEGIRICYESFTNCKDVQCLCREIEELFSDGRPSVMLSTIHKAKGLENDNVFILEHNLLPFRWKGMQDHEYEQEVNAQYIAESRAKKKLVLVRDDVPVIKKKELVTTAANA